MPFSWSLPYPSRREAVLARNVVATSQPLAAQAGLSMLDRGGNAVDAAIAAAATLTVVEPTSNGIGSDAFAIVWAGGGMHGLNASGVAPAAFDKDRFAGMDSIPTRGWGGVTVPGAVSAWVALSERFGALPFETLLEPAIRYAREGFAVSRQTAGSWSRSRAAYADFPSWLATFAPSGRGPRPGEMRTLPDHARTLELIAESKGAAFYQGELAARIAAHARDTDGWITEADLAAHAPEWVRPLALDYRGRTLHEIPPNGQGITAQVALGMLRHHALAGLEVDGPDFLHVQIEAMKLAFADARRFIADPRTMDVDPQALLDAAYLEERAKSIDMATAADPGHGEPPRGGTVYLTAADADGTMISYIQSNYTGFGSGVVVPDTGISLQNRGCCFSLEPGHPNEAAPGKRPYHTIIPGFVTDTASEQPVMSFGVMGGFMQPQGHAQVLVRMVDHEQNPQAALDAPRWRIEQGREVVIEPGFDPAVYEALRERGHDVRIARAQTVSHGGGQAIHVLDGGAYFGASDHRRDGQAVGR